MLETPVLIDFYKNAIVCMDFGSEYFFDKRNAGQHFLPKYEVNSIVPPFLRTRRYDLMLWGDMSYTCRKSLLIVGIYLIRKLDIFKG